MGRLGSRVCGLRPLQVSEFQVCLALFPPPFLIGNAQSGTMAHGHSGLRKQDPTPLGVGHGGWGIHFQPGSIVLSQDLGDHRSQSCRLITLCPGQLQLLQDSLQPLFGEHLLNYKRSALALRTDSLWDARDRTQDPLAKLISIYP